MMMISTVLSNSYIALTSAKLAQWLILRSKKRFQTQKVTSKVPSTDNSNHHKKNDDNDGVDDDNINKNNINNKPKVQAGDGPMEFSPSLQALMVIFNFYLQEDVHKKSRKEFREITDPWLEAYKQKLATRKKKSKTFHSLNEALKDFFCEFTQETISWQVDFSKYIVGCFLQHPLGLVAVGDLILTVCIIPFFLLREYVWMGGNSATFYCKGAASATINEVYVVCCKENISFETALHKYPWMTGVFSKPQLHPMVGMAVCPLYRRKVEIPMNDVMNFDIEVLKCPTGTALLRQRHASWWGNLLEDAAVSYGLVLAAVMALIYFEGIAGVLAVSKFAMPFYVVRVLVDRELDIRWMDQFFYLP